MTPPLPIPSVSMHVARAAFAEAMARGHDERALCARFGLTPAALAEPNGRIPVDVLREIWSELPALTGIDDLGIAVARRAGESGALPALAHLLRSAATVGDGLRLALRYQRLVTEAVTTHWVDAGDEIRLVVDDRDPAFRLPRHAIEFGVAALLLLARSATEHAFVPRRIAFRHAAPRDHTESRRLFACPIAYDAGVNVITFARADLARPQRSSDRSLAEILERHARALEARLPGCESFAAAVRRALVDLLEANDPGLATVAAKLRVSPRTLQRRLAAEGTTHRRVRDELRCDLALRHLESGDLGLQEIAFVLGFSDQSTFHHAFVRWTGRTPGAHRRQRLG
ncbi:MAG: AraC family transcriptional regulator [bacterium]|nr:AraC family transcriptional regulator [bacterium]